jgi:hypothetical protein
LGLLTHGCATIDTAPSNQKSINFFLKKTDKEILRPGETIICLGYQEKRGNFKRKFTAYLFNPAKGSKKSYSQVKIGEKQKVYLRYFGMHPEKKEQIWGETKSNEEAIRFVLTRPEKGFSGDLKFFNSKGGIKIHIKKLQCKQR